MRVALWVTFAAALGTYCLVQDRVTAAGARRYVALQQDALAGRGPVVTIDEVMRPAVDRSVRLALYSSGAVAAVGVGAAFGGRAIQARRLRSRGLDA
jgi:hypothetical protein